jgi:hypothetical protein
MRRAVLVLVVLNVCALGVLAVTRLGRDDTGAVRDVATTYAERLAGDEPVSACKLAARPAECVRGLLAVARMGAEPGSLLPRGWRRQLRSARVTVDGSRARIMVSPDPWSFVRVDGDWRVTTTGS